MGRPGSSRTWSTAATVRATSSGSATGASSTSHTPSPAPSSASAATCNASRDLPIPPGPAIVTSRDPPDTSDRSSASSRGPAHETGCLRWQVVAQRRVVQRPQRAEPPGQARPGHLEDPLGTAQVLQLMLAQIPKPDPAGQPAGQQLVRRPGHQDLTTMAGREQPGDPVHHRTEIVAVALHAGPRMQRHPHPDGRAGRPRLSTDGPLDRHRRRQRGGRVGEHRTKRLAHRLEHVTARNLDLLADNAVMAGRRLRHSLAVGLPQPDAALDIGEQQRHRARGEPHRPLCTPDPAPACSSRAEPTPSAVVAASNVGPGQPEPSGSPTSKTDGRRPGYARPAKPEMANPSSFATLTTGVSSPHGQYTDVVGQRGWLSVRPGRGWRRA